MKEVVTTFVHLIAQPSRQGTLSDTLSSNGVPSFVQDASFPMRLIDVIDYVFLFDFLRASWVNKNLKSAHPEAD
ncbi:MAG: hypothetical protein INF64_03625 [Roseomonas sp.]|nr:hypothetical protein [Roseomonas sp.]